ncbi:hypothetical protein BGZ61DRAFT_449749 [Ilyonectria robusta]|uniref:uncharacterized protein n=1 Tax=Ilyonectria robusta TaxID=1079257 RepID=UPI001E8E3548|nr:uncharacterized protein BGZ61DRAFT_449749 [Ilyonectria robusta]KAH8706339.1 hypothetical protein BGZ61DRAFT_449749 [Ilyonectria robusta]
MVLRIMDRLRLRLSPSSEPTKTEKNPADFETELETENDQKQRKKMENREQATVRSQLRHKHWDYIIEFHQRWMDDGSMPYVTLPCFESGSLTEDIKNFFGAISASFDDSGLADDHPIRGRILSLNAKSQFTLYLELNAQNKKSTEANSTKG